MTLEKWLWRPAQTPMPELWLQLGLTSAQIDQLVTITHADALIAQTTHDLARFPDTATVQKWLQGSRQVLALVDATGNLLGIVWLSQKNLPTITLSQLLPKWQAKLTSADLKQYVVTFGVRLYEGVRGQGLAQPLVRTAFQRLAPSGKVWLQTKITNTPAIRTYQKAGFQQITAPDANQEIFMIQL